MGPETPFASFARCCEAMRGTASRREKQALAAAFLRGLAPAERAAGARFLAGKALPEVEGPALDVGWSALSQALKASAQRTLHEAALTVGEAARELEAIAAVRGADARKRKARRVRALLGRCSPEERPWLAALLSGEMRTGASDGVVLDAVAHAAQVEPALVRRAHMLRGDLGEVAALALGDAAALREARLRVLRPLRPMLAGTCPSVAEALAQLGGEAAVEPKFDGARIALHRQGAEVRVFSRRLTDVTASVPDVVEEGRALRCEEAVVEGEAVAYDARGRPLPFQELMRRFRRVHGVAEERARVPLTVHLFDCLHVDGATLLDRPAEERWAALARIARPEALAPRRVVRAAAEGEAVLRDALAAGHEGVMVKALRSPYSPGTRGTSWLKVKPAASLDLVVIGAEWGSGRRQGWLSNYHLAVRVAEGDEGLVREVAGTPRGPVTRAPGFAMVGKTFKGLTDAEFGAMTARLKGLALGDLRWGVRVRPEVVVEVEHNEIQRSPHYDSGYALRFARIKAVRDDKGPEEASTLGELRRLYEAQGRLKGAAPGP
jgi:DNA ligase-1